MKPVMKGVVSSAEVRRSPSGEEAGEEARRRGRLGQDLDADAARLKNLIQSDGRGGRGGEELQARFSKGGLRAPGGMARASGLRAPSSMLKGVKSNFSAGVKGASPRTRALSSGGAGAFASRSAGGAPVRVSQEQTSQASQAPSAFEGSDSAASSASSAASPASTESGAPPAEDGASASRASAEGVSGGVGAKESSSPSSSASASGSVSGREEVPGGDVAHAALRRDRKTASSPVAVEHSSSATPASSSSGAGVVSDAAPPPDSSAMSASVQEVATRILVGQPQASGGQEVRITVNQEILPGTEVRMREMHGMLTVELVTTSPQAHTVLAGQSEALRNWLGNATRLNVDVRLAYSGGQSDGDAAGGRSRGRFRFQDEDSQA